MAVLHDNMSENLLLLVSPDLRLRFHHLWPPREGDNGLAWQREWSEFLDAVNMNVHTVEYVENIIEAAHAWRSNGTTSVEMLMIKGLLERIMFRMRERLRNHAGLFPGVTSLVFSDASPLCCVNLLPSLMLWVGRNNPMLHSCETLAVQFSELRTNMLNDGLTDLPGLHQSLQAIMHALMDLVLHIRRRFQEIKNLAIATSTREVTGRGITLEGFMERLALVTALDCADVTMQMTTLVVGGLNEAHAR